jgi:hypothetical protein
MTAHGIGPNPEGEDAKAPEKETPATGIGFLGPNSPVLIVQIDMGRVGMAQARGTLLNADDIIKSWYQERAKYDKQNHKKIHLPGANAVKDAVVNFFKR